MEKIDAASRGTAGYYRPGRFVGLTLSTKLLFFVAWITLMLETDGFPLLPVFTTLPQFTWFANVCRAIFFTFL